MKRLFSFLLLVQHFTITLLNDQDYSPDGRLIVNVISERVLGPGEAFLDEPSTDGQPEAVVKEGIQRSCHSFSFTNDRPH